MAIRNKKSKSGSLSSDEHVIQIKDLCKNFQMGDTVVQALRGISFDLAHGEYMSIMGTSGSGKSTLLNILGCLDIPSSGEYFLDGLAVAQMSDNELSAVRRKKIGFIFQSFNLLGQLSVLENISVPLFYQGWAEKDSRERAAKLAELVGLGHRLKHKPTELSGGQCQRVAIARALANEPALIFADEPTGNLDSATGREIMQILDGLASEGRTIILVTHERDIAEHAKRIINLTDGVIASDERHP
ncbi:MAG: ABC transporter ATP-binding protein [Lentisphaerae bacterium]|jgi:putative ABC transport system ATP-binding protein|nr:ABC transporter ATP-binding protein [Lentisphaerota bacterium]